MKTFYCEEIACGGCAARIDRALDAAGIRHSVDLENKTVTVEETRRGAGNFVRPGIYAGGTIKK